MQAQALMVGLLLAIGWRKLMGLNIHLLKLVTGSIITWIIYLYENESIPDPLSSARI